jgi:hypothetical protein
MCRYLDGGWADILPPDYKLPSLEEWQKGRPKGYELPKGINRMLIYETLGARGSRVWEAYGHGWQDE